MWRLVRLVLPQTAAGRWDGLHKWAGATFRWEPTILSGHCFDSEGSDTHSRIWDHCVCSVIMVNSVSPDKELALLRGENRRNTLLSVALLAVAALFYYAFFYNDEDSWWIYCKWSTGDRGDLIITWTKWEWGAQYLGSACRRRYRCFYFCLFKPFGPKVFAFPLSVELRGSSLNVWLSGAAYIFAANLQNVSFCHLHEPAEICLIFFKVLLTPNCPMRKSNVPHNPIQWIKEKVLHNVSGFYSPLRHIRTVISRRIMRKYLIFLF